MIPKHHEDRWTKTCLQLVHRCINQARRGGGNQGPDGVIMEDPEDESWELTMPFQWNN